jgi:hypothetical protein
MLDELFECWLRKASTGKTQKKRKVTKLEGMAHAVSFCVKKIYRIRDQQEKK